MINAINLQFGEFVKCRDIDVLLHLVYNAGLLDVETWMESEMSKADTCFLVYPIAMKLRADVIRNLLRSLLFTGCDTMSSFCGISKVRKGMLQRSS